MSRKSLGKAELYFTPLPQANPQFPGIKILRPALASLKRLNLPEEFLENLS